MKTKEQFPETWVERQLRMMNEITKEACASSQTALSYMVSAKMISLRKAKKHGYIPEPSIRKARKEVKQIEETWIERQIRLMKKATEEACASPQSALSYMVSAKMISLREAKKYGYVPELRKKRSNRD